MFKGLFRRKAEAPAFQANSASHGLIEKGDSLRRERRYEEALSYYVRATQVDPGNATAWRMRAEALAMRFKYTEAVDSCTRALEIDPSDAPTWFLRSFAFGMLQEYEEALTSCTKGLEIDPADTMAWCTRGEYLYSLGRLEEALEAFGTALTVNPQSQYARDVTDKVRKWLKRDGQDDAWVDQVVKFLESGSYRDALDSYRQALGTDPRGVDRSFAKDFALAQLENPEKLLDDYYRAQQEHQPRLVLTLSQTEFQFGAWSSVKVTLENAGNATASDIDLQFPPEFKGRHMKRDAWLQPVDQRKLARGTDTIPELQPGSKIEMLLDLLPTRIGAYPLDVGINYTDSWNIRRRLAKSLWLTFFKPGQRLPRVPGYRMLWRLHAGQLASVYAARREKDGLRVAIKMPTFLPPILNPDLLREVKAWSKLNHPHAVRVYECPERPPHWIAMEYMEGGSLRKRIGQLSVADSVEIGVKLASALSHARRLGVTHRSIKPENVLFDRVETPKLSDWRIGAVMSRVTEPAGMPRETVEYLAPERISTEFGGADWRTDIYQLGVLLYEMVTGKTPFQGDRAVVMERIKDEEPTRPSQLNPEVGQKLDLIILGCLAKHREDRYQDAATLMADLQAAFQSCSTVSQTRIQIA